MCELIYFFQCTSPFKMYLKPKKIFQQNEMTFLCKFSI